MNSLSIKGKYPQRPSGDKDKKPPSSPPYGGPSGDKDKKPPSSPPQGSSSQRPGGQGSPNQSGCKTILCNCFLSIKNVLSNFIASGNQRPRPPSEV